MRIWNNETQAWFGDDGRRLEIYERHASKTPKQTLATAPGLGQWSQYPSGESRRVLSWALTAEPWVLISWWHVSGHASLTVVQSAFWRCIYSAVVGPKWSWRNIGDVISRCWNCLFRLSSSGFPEMGEVTVIPSPTLLTVSDQINSWDQEWVEKMSQVLKPMEISLVQRIVVFKKSVSRTFHGNRGR